MEFCLFNPSAMRWEQMAWAYVKDDEEARELCEKYGFSSWQFQDDKNTPAMDLFKKSVQQLVSA